ncbi:MAG: hypothetical protein LJE73_02515 [Proteobacteria bacterium]|jgi:hypothetical protein|nr:hypothetical protein [Pseudomonadota bacterium]
MRLIAAFIMRGRWQAMVATAGLAILALLLMPLSWPLSYLSGGVVGLVTLVQGPKEGVLNAAGAILLVAVLAMLLVGQPTVAAGFAVMLWMPAWLLAIVLYLSRSQALMLLVNVLLAMASVIVVFALVPDPAQWWHTYLAGEVIPMLKQAGMVIPDEAAFMAGLETASRLMTGAMVASISFGLAMSLITARWWQAVVGNRPGAFGEEFRALRLGRIAASAAVLLSLLMLFIQGTLAELSLNLLEVMIIAFMFQGLAVGHALAHQFKANQAWLVMMYIVMIFTLPYGLLLVALVGVLDNGFDFRARFRPRA